VKLDDGSDRTIDYGFVGDIDAVNTAVLLKLLDNGLMPVVSPLSADEKGVLLNINADTVAAAIGAAVQAEKLILCTGAPGILEDAADPGLAHLLHRPARPAAPARRRRRFRMACCRRRRRSKTALRGGVRRVHIVSYKTPEGILGEVFTNEGTGHACRCRTSTPLTPAEITASAVARLRS
jgi:acetylglutamate kinase